MNCAGTIVELITHYWPYSIDILEPERAIIDGFRPIFFAGQENVRLLAWLGYQGLNVANRPISRGHSLVTAREKPSSLVRVNVWHFIGDTPFCTNPFYPGILVRNDATKVRLEERLEGSLIMSGLISLHQLFI